MTFSEKLRSLVRDQGRPLTAQEVASRTGRTEAEVMRDMNKGLSDRTVRRSDRGRQDGTQRWTT